MSLTEAQKAVRQFHEVMIGRAVTPSSPVELSAYNGDLRCSLIDEEAAEFQAAWRSGDQLAMIDALCDLLYVTLGAAVEMGVELEPFFAEVHRANMAKVGGQIRGDGKQLKPPGWRPPDMEGVFSSLYQTLPDRRLVQEALALPEDLG